MTTDCDRTESREADEIANVVSSHARIHEGAVMVEPVNAAAAGWTMLRSKRSLHKARAAKQARMQVALHC